MARRTSLVAIAILAVVVPLLGLGAAEAAPGSTLLIGFRPSSASFSPNGDGRRDTATAHYTLTATARVYARVVDGDGNPPSEPITFNRTSVYPATKVFADAVRFKFPIKTTARAAVRRPDGSLVRRLSLRKVACNPDLPIGTGNVCTLTGWNGRDARGRVVAPGRYVLRSVMADPAGNRRISHTRLTVSAKPLVERTRTTTVAAAELAAATRTPCGYYPGAPEGCDDWW